MYSYKDNGRRTKNTDITKPGRIKFDPHHNHDLVYVPTNIHHRINR